MTKRIPFTDTFHLGFDTLDQPGRITCVEIRIRKISSADDSRVYRLDLCEHPLYRALVQYVADNPPKGAADA